MAGPANLRYEPPFTVSSKVAVMLENVAQLVDELQTQSALGNKARMVDLCGRISAIEPENPEALITIGLLAWRHGKRDESELLLRRAAERHPSHPECLASLADILTARGRHEEAIGYYRQSVAMRPDDPNTLLRAARVMFRAGDAPAAITLLREALDPEQHCAISAAATATSS